MIRERDEAEAADGGPDAAKKQRAADADAAAVEAPGADGNAADAAPAPLAEGAADAAAPLTDGAAEVPGTVPPAAPDASAAPAAPAAPVAADAAANAVLPAVERVAAAALCAAGKYDFAVRLKGLAWDCGVDAVRAFLGLEALELDQIVFVYNGPGEALLRLQTRAEVDQALTKHQATLNATGDDARLIQVLESTPADADAAQAEAAKRPDGAYRGVVKLRGLPWGSTGEGIAAFLGSAGVEAGGVTLLCNADGRQSGDAFAVFDSEAGADDAVLKYHKMKMGSRWIHLSTTTRGEIYASQTTGDDADNNVLVQQQPAQTESGVVSLPDPSSDVAVLRLRGLPYDATTRQVADFFGAWSVEETAVFLVAPDGRPSGEAFVTFVSHDSARDASEQMHKKDMGGRWVEIFPASAAEVAHRCQPPLSGLTMPDAEDKACVRLRGLPFVATLADVRRLVDAAFGAFAAAQAPPSAAPPLQLQAPDSFAIFMINGAHDRRPTGEGYLLLEGGQAEAEQAAVALNGATLGDRQVAAAAVDKSELYQCLGDVALQSRCVKLRGLPFSVCHQESQAATFLNGVEPILNFLLCRSDRGATGEAYAELGSPAAALHAISRNRAHLGGRFVEVFPVSADELRRARQSAGHLRGPMGMPPRGGQFGGGGYPMRGGPYGGGGFPPQMQMQQGGRGPVYNIGGYNPQQHAYGGGGGGYNPQQQQQQMQQMQQQQYQQQQYAAYYGAQQQQAAQQPGAAAQQQGGAQQGGAQQYYNAAGPWDGAQPRPFG
ncbi:hypothetical protein M885DRAFT_510884 [Pelagophyceae sp. CCMP2097]|nr:hypothetical protein M885DRAFT_510884 [Pelagophyceae sp. CCMP2097]